MKVRMLESVMEMPGYHLIEVGTEVEVDPKTAVQWIESRLAIPVPTSGEQQAVVAPPEVRVEHKRQTSKGGHK